MASVPSCAPCVFGASSSLLSYPNPVTTVPVSVNPVLVTGLNGSASISYQTTTLTGDQSSGTGITVTHTSDLTWSTLGTILTYPNTYVQYLGFVGAAATAPATTACAQSLTPTPLTTPTTVDPASFIYSYNGATNLPQQLLGYLDSASGFVAQLNGDQLTDCAIIQTTVSVVPSTSAQTIPTESLTSETLSTVVSSTFTSTFLTSSAFLTTTIITSTSTTAVTSTLVTSVAPSSSTLGTLPTLVSSTAPSTSSSQTTVSISTSTSSTSVHLPETTSTIVTTTQTRVLSSTLVSSTTIVVTSAEVVATEQTVQHTPVVLLSTVTGKSIIVPSSSSTSSSISSSGSSSHLTTLLSPQEVTLPGPTSSPPMTLQSSHALSGSSTTPVSTAPVGNLLSLIESIVVPLPAASTSATSHVAPYGNMTKTESTVAVGPATGVPTSNSTRATSISPVPYTGDGGSRRRPSGSGVLECVIGLALPLLL